MTSRGRRHCVVCSTRAVFGYEDKKPQYCSRHKTPDMRDVVNPMCKEGGCNKRATCGEGGTPTKCRMHAPTSPNVTGKKCEIKNCDRHAVYGTDRATRCSQHKDPDMIDVKTARCDHEGCSRHPSFGYTMAMRCEEHRDHDMVNVKSERCQAKGCQSLLPSFNFPGSRRGARCGSHRLDGMVNVHHAKCLGQDCGALGNPKYDGYCVQHFIQEFPDDPRTANVGKSGAEVQMESWLDKHPIVKFYTKTAIQCGGRQLYPDALVTLTNGHQVLIECDGP